MEGFVYRLSHNCHIRCITGFHQAIAPIYLVELFVPHLLLVIGVSRTSLTLFEKETVPSAVRCGKDRILSCLIVGIHASRISVPLSLLMLLEYEVYLM